MQGNAQLSIGIMKEANGVKRDFTEAFYWFKKAAKQGNDLAQFNTGSMYFKGRGVKQNFTESFRWYKNAALQGYASAQFNMGACTMRVELFSRTSRTPFDG